MTALVHNFGLSSQDIHRIHLVDSLVCKYLKTSLYSFCISRKYDPLFIELVRLLTEDPCYGNRYFSGGIRLEIQDSVLQERADAVHKKLCTVGDTRYWEQKMISLATSWVVEDIIVSKSHSTMILTGCDSSRSFLTEEKGSTPDIRYVGKGKTYYIEICSAFTDFVQRNSRYDLRLFKYYKLQDLYFLHKENTLLLFVDIHNETYACMWVSQLIRKVRADATLINKFRENTVAVDFTENVEYKPLQILFDKCKDNIVNPNIYNNFGSVRTPESTQKNELEAPVVLASEDKKLPEGFVEYTGWTPWDEEDTPW